MSGNDAIEKAWRYYKHADDLQHRRHQLFLTVQGALVAGFVASHEKHPKVSLVFVIAGVLFVLIWATLIETVARGMEHLNCKLKEGDETYKEYLAEVRRQPFLYGRWILNIYLPALMLLVWFLLWCTS